MANKRKHRARKVWRWTRRSFFVVLYVTLLFVAALGLVWIKDAGFFSKNRSVYSREEIAEFKQTGCVRNIENLRPFEEPLVSVVFDDGWESVYSKAFKVLESQCVASTQYLLSGYFDDPDHMSVEQAHSMQNAGHEIAAHGVHHTSLTQFSNEELVQQLEQSRGQLSAEFGGTVHEFAAPNGEVNDQVMWQIKRHFRSHRNTRQEKAVINTKSQFDPYSIHALVIKNDTSQRELRTLLEKTRKTNGWLVLVYHQIDDRGGLHTVSPATLAMHLSLIQDANIRTASMGLVLNHFER